MSYLVSRVFESVQTLISIPIKNRIGVFTQNFQERYIHMGIFIIFHVVRALVKTLKVIELFSQLDEVKI